MTRFGKAKKKMAAFSASIPFSEPLWYSRGISPYYKESHHRLRAEAREYVDTHLSPFCEEWEREGAVPAEVPNSPFPEILLRSGICNPRCLFLGNPTTLGAWVHGRVGLPLARRLPRRTASPRRHPGVRVGWIPRSDRHRRDCALRILGCYLGSRVRQRHRRPSRGQLWKPCPEEEISARDSERQDSILSRSYRT